MAEHKPYYTLSEIALWDENETVSLPTVQRGFVWKPAQIENLWDSLLRGYPVGAFVLSDAGNNALHILDGQQRATAICLGFAKETFRDSQDYYKVFIDLESPRADDSRKYIFRVITKSHPWGYQRQENTKILTAENIRKAMDLYEEVTDPLNTPLNKFFPYDAGLPVPLHFFLNAAAQTPAATEEELIKSIKEEFPHWKEIVNRWEKDNKETLSNYNEQEIKALIHAKISTIYREVMEMLHSQKGQKIPALYMNLEKVMNSTKQEVEEASDEVENLFVRLNSGGTQLSGEELNYSILKAHLQRPVQDEIENACKQLFKPARFITIAYRLYQQEKKEEKQTDALTMRIKPKQFQRTISKQVKKFEDFILSIIRDKDFEGKTLLEYTQSILEYKNTAQQNYGLPFLIYSKIADTAPELMFLLLYRIKFKNDRFSNAVEADKKQHQNMLGMLTLFMWFGKGENLKDHAKLLVNIWPSASTLEKNRFWSSETVDRAYLNDVLLPFPSFHGNNFEIGLKKILDYNLTEKTSIINRFEIDGGKQYTHFLLKIINNSDLILYAQRHFIEKYFHQQQFRLEDTSLPFDWDHISPNNFVRNRKNILQIVKDWYQTNGNFRAWPYALNRMDSDKSPANKLNPLENIDDIVSSELKIKWLNFINRNKHLITDINELSEKLTEWSFCEKEWSSCFSTDMRLDWKPVTRLIIRRNIQIIKDWYDTLNIEILRIENKVKFEEIFDNRKWGEISEDNDVFKNEFNFNENINRISSSFLIDSSELNFYISYPDGDNGYLKENKIEFGLFDRNGSNYIAKMKNKTEFELDYDKFKWVFNRFSIVSSHNKSYEEFTIEIANWLRKLPVSVNDKNLLVSEFREMLSSKFKATII